jgi:hypothetical protein
MGPCLEKIKVPDHIKEKLTDLSDQYKEKGLSELEADRKALTEFHKELFDDMNELRKAVGEKPVEYKPHDNSEEVAQVEKKYADLAKDKTFRPENEDLKPYEDTQGTLDRISEYYKDDPLVSKTVDFLKPILEKNPNIKIDTAAKVPEGVLGYSYPDGRIELNFDKIGNYDTLYRTALHEMMHAVTRNEIEKNPAFKDELRDALGDIRKALDIPDNDSLIEYFIQTGIIEIDKYGGTNEYELIAEVFSNQKFFDYLKGIKYKGDNLLKRVVQRILEYFSKSYKELSGVKKEIDAGDMADYITKLTEGVMKDKDIASREGEPMQLEMPDFNRRKIKQLIKNSDLSPDEIKEALSERGFSEGEINSLISESRESAQKEKVYEEIAGSKPNTKTGRVSVDPIVSGQPKDISKIIFDVSKALGQKVSYLKPGRRKSIGVYNTGNAGIKIKFTGDLDTTAHEIGHAIDDGFGILKNITPEIEKELKPFSKHGSTPPKGHPNPKDYINGEGFAEWLRAYIVNPGEAKKLAPETHKLFESTVSDSFKKGLQEFSNDIRTFAGASGRDMTLSNIQWEPTKAKGIIKQIFDKSDKTNMFSVSWVDKLAANMINPMRAFEKAFKYAKGLRGIDEVLPENDPTILSRLLLSVDRKFGEFLKNGLHDSKDNPILDSNGKPKNFKWLIEPLDNADQKTITTEMKDTMAYMVAERTKELAGKFNRNEILTGIGGGIFKDAEVAQKALDEFNNGDPKKLERIKEAGSRYREFADHILQYMVDKGRLSEEAYQAIKKDNTEYVALNRILEATPEEELTGFKGSGGVLGSVKQTIHNIKGSTRKIQNPYTSLLDVMHKSIKESDRNEVLKAFRDMLVASRGMHQGEPVKLAEVGTIAKTGDKNSITIFVDGKAERWVFQKDVYDALKGLDNDGYKLPGILTLHARLLRNMTTKFPTFALRNWIRDTQDRLIKTNEKSGLSHLFGNKEHWKDIARQGGLNSGYYLRDKEHYYGLMEQAIDELSKKQKTIFADPVKIKKLWHGYEDMLQTSETSNRVAEYRAAFKIAKDKGMDDYNAALYGAYKARDLIDFAVMGHWMRIVNQLIPFSNAAVQGLRSTAIRIKENPGGFLGRMVLYTVLPQGALWMINHRDKETAEEYENLPAYQRDMFWNLKIGPNNWLSIPKPYELGIFASGVDRMLSSIFTGNKDSFEGYGGSVAKTLLPFDEGNLSGPAQPAVESMVNYDFFRNKSIIPDEENGLDLSLRHTENGSRLGQFIQKMAGIDSRKIDHMIRAQFSYVGNMAIKVSDVGRSDSRNQFDLTDTGLFKKSPAYNSPPVQDLLHFAQRWDLTKQAAYREFKGKAGEYFNAKGDKEKDKKAKELIEFAKELMSYWKEIEIDKHQKERADAKKEEEKGNKEPEQVIIKPWNPNE